jgi:hypothetical protein
MEKITMHREALECYLSSKIMEFKSVSIRTLKIRQLKEAVDSCNWTIETLDCDMPPGMMPGLEIEVIAPLQRAIDVAGNGSQ